MEACHPILSRRSTIEVDNYRKENGISIDRLRGEQPIPKPFQEWRETTFPSFVIELAQELFTSDSKPFPIQAQGWPCALSGVDFVGVAPTGSGKTLMFLLPALVHIMFQEMLAPGDGPIAIVLQPTRELAEQSLSVAKRFFERSPEEDRFRVAAVYGGTSMWTEVPKETESWPDMLICTPHRLHSLIRNGQLDTNRISICLLDEADELLTGRAWSQVMRRIMRQLRPDRQLITASATWPPEAEKAFLEIAGPNVVKVQITPSIPSIPQELRLFPGAIADKWRRMQQWCLKEWLEQEFQPDESVLVLCQSRANVDELAKDEDLPKIVGGDIAALLGGQDDRTEANSKAYAKFIQREARVLISTFGQGARGLDYTNTMANGAAGAGPKLKLVVLLYDFPLTLSDYIHCIGRTQRPGQESGRCVAFLPEFRFWMAPELQELLMRSGQPVPLELEELIKEDGSFRDYCQSAMSRMRRNLPPHPEGQRPPDYLEGQYNPDLKVWILPGELPSYRRRILHSLADELEVAHVSWTDPHRVRRLHLAMDREALPEKYFLLGEKVYVHASNERADYGTSRYGYATIVDPKVKPRSRTVGVVFERQHDQEDICVDLIELAETPMQNNAGNANGDNYKDEDGDDEDDDDEPPPPPPPPLPPQGATANGW